MAFRSGLRLISSWYRMGGVLSDVAAVSSHENRLGSGRYCRGAVNSWLLQGTRTCIGSDVKGPDLLRHVLAMIIGQMNCVFSHKVPLTERVMAASADMSLATSLEFVASIKGVHHVEGASGPACFTAHYGEEHTPHLVHDREGPSKSRIPIQRLRAHRSDVRCGDLHGS